MVDELKSHDVPRLERSLVRIDSLLESLLESSELYAELKAVRLAVVKALAELRESVSASELVAPVLPLCTIPAKSKGGGGEYPALSFTQEIWNELESIFSHRETGRRGSLRAERVLVALLLKHGPNGEFVHRDLLMQESGYSWSGLYTPHSYSMPKWLVNAGYKTEMKKYQFRLVKIS